MKKKTWLSTIVIYDCDHFCSSHYTQRGTCHLLVEHSTCVLNILLQFIISFLILQVAFQLLGLDGSSASTLNNSKLSGVFSVYCCQSWLVQTWRLQAAAEAERRRRSAMLGLQVQPLGRAGGPMNGRFRKRPHRACSPQPGANPVP